MNTIMHLTRFSKNFAVTMDSTEGLQFVERLDVTIAIRASKQEQCITFESHTIDVNKVREVFLMAIRELPDEQLDAWADNNFMHNGWDIQELADMLMSHQSAAA